MKWIEQNPIPEECKFCREEDCYNCDVAGKRWILSPEDEQKVRLALARRAAQRLQIKEMLSGFKEP